MLGGPFFLHPVKIKIKLLKMNDIPLSFLSGIFTYFQNVNMAQMMHHLRALADLLDF